MMYAKCLLTLALSGLLLPLLMQHSEHRKTVRKQAALPDLLFDISSDITAELAMQAFRDEDVAEDRLSGTVLTIDVGSLPSQSDLSGYHLLANGDQLLSLDTGVQLPADLTTRPADIIRFDGIGYALLFDSASEGIPEGVTVDAVSSTDGADLLISLDVSVKLPGDFTADDEDLIRFDGSAFTLFLDGSEIGIDPALDLDAVHYLPAQGLILLSLDGGGMAGGLPFDDEDVLAFDPAAETWAMAYDGSALHPAWREADLDALHASSQLFTLSVDLGDSGLGRVVSSPTGINCGSDCSEDYVSGMKVALIPVVDGDPAAQFEAWGGEVDCSDGMVTLDASKTCIAFFSPAAFSLQVSREGAGNGTVSSAPPGIDCGIVCQADYASGTVVSLTAVPDPQGESIPFAGWRGDLDCLDGIATLDRDLHCIAIFETSRFGLRISKGGSGLGTVISDPPGIDCGTGCGHLFVTETNVQLSAFPQPGSAFEGWQGDPDCSDGGVTMDSAKACSAIFDRIAFPVTVSISKAGSGGGRVFSDPQGIDCGTDCSELFTEPLRLRLIAEPSQNSFFAGWSGDPDCGDGVVGTASDKACIATFELQQPRPFTLSISKAGDGEGTVTSSPQGIFCGSDCSTSFAAATTVSLSARPETSSTFNGWSGDPDCIDGLLTMDADKACTATFARN